jgi:hypothetical protein
MPVIAAVALGGTGLGLQLKGQHEAGKAAEAQAKSEAAWQEYNAKLAEREAVEAQEAAAYEESKHRKAGERLKARQRVMLGQGGVLPELSAMDVLEETASELEMDALMIRRSGTVGAQRLTAGAQLSRMASRSALLRGRSAKRAARNQMWATGLSGAGSLAYQKYRMDN